MTGNTGKFNFSVVLLCLSLSSCRAEQPGVEFYEGLKKRQNGELTEAAACFEKAINADNPHIAAAAAAELASLRPDEDEPFAASEAENAAANGRIAASRSRYHEALLFFRIVLDDSPELFFRDPDLLADLGRTFQYTGAGKEGMDLFLQWEKIWDDEGEAPKALREAIPEGGENLVRFRLLFFAARMARQRGERSIELFEQALPFARAVSPEQIDACIWYILDSSLAAGTAATIKYVETYRAQWHDDDYFFDVLDKLARECMLRRQWDAIFSVFTLLHQTARGEAGGAAAAKYAWIVSRLIEEGLLLPPKVTAPKTGGAESYMRSAYHAGGVPYGAVGYYRSLSAAALGEPFLTLADAPPQEAAKDNASEALQFLLGFFEHDAVQFAPRYIRAMENDLCAGELQRVAGALGAAAQYQESIRLVALYINRSGYQLTANDLKLLYPCPFREAVERYAHETGIEPALLYGLIRTESAFDRNAVSRAGAVGLSQLMPATAEEMAIRIRRRGGPNYIQTSVDEDSPAVIDLYDPAVNIHIGATYLAYLNERMDDPLLALLAYNGGMNRIRRWRAAVNRSAGNLPPDLFLETVEYAETRNYGRSVMGAAAMYKELYY